MASQLIGLGLAPGGENGSWYQPVLFRSAMLQWKEGARFARLNYLISRDLADADRRPLWYKGDYFADLFAPNAPRAAAPAGSAAATVGTAN